MTKNGALLRIEPAPEARANPVPRTSCDQRSANCSTSCVWVSPAQPGPVSAGGEHLTNLALAAARHLQERVCQPDGLLLRRRVQDGKARDELLRLGERPIRDDGLSARAADTRSHGAWQAAFGRD